MKRIKDLQYISIEEVLIRKYRFKEPVAKECADFLKLGLKLDISQRASAEDLLQHPWLEVNPAIDLDIKMSEEEYSAYHASNTLAQKNNQMEHYQADSEYSNAETVEEPGVYDESRYSHDRRICDRSFTDLGYIGYHEGIQLN